MRARLTLGLVLVAACAESPFVDTYAWDKDQLLIMYSPDRPQQVFYREAGAPGWTATASSTLEAPPPVAGIWRWNFSDWAVVDLGEGVAAIVTEDCDPLRVQLAALADRLRVERCGPLNSICCMEGSLLPQERAGGCPIPDFRTNPQAAVCLFAH